MIVPTRVHRLLALVLAPCTMYGGSYRRHEARVGRYNTMCSWEYSGVFVPLNINTTCVGNARCLLVRAIVLRSMPWRRGHRWEIAKQRNAKECQKYVMRWEHRDYVWYV